jgi:ribosomal-protein-alanine acetyltransferase
MTSEISLPSSNVVKIRLATPEDVPHLIELDRASGTAAHWTAELYQDLFRTDSACPRLLLLAEAPDGSVIGFLVAQHATPEWELENIVVSAPERRKGIGIGLLQALIETVRQARGEAVLLEVRESNECARCFYSRAGFQQSGRRKAYYSNPLEDAVLYRLSLR